MIKEHTNYSAEDSINAGVYQNISDSLNSAEVISIAAWDTVYNLVHQPVRNAIHTSLRSAVGRDVCNTIDDLRTQYEHNSNS